MGTKISKYRFVGLYPFRLMEAEVKADGKTIYVCLDVDSVKTGSGSDKEDRELQSWAFTLPADAEGHEDSYADFDEKDIAGEMAERWKADPVFKEMFDKKTNNWVWQEWEALP